MTARIEPPLCLTSRGAYVWAQAAALRAHDAGDNKARAQAWHIGYRYVSSFSLAELMELDREARALVDGVTVEPLTDEQLRTAKRGTVVRDNLGRQWVKANTLYHRYARGSDPGERQPGYWLRDQYGPIWPVRRS